MDIDIDSAAHDTTRHALACIDIQPDTRARSHPIPSHQSINQLGNCSWPIGHVWPLGHSFFFFFFFFFFLGGGGVFFFFFSQIGASFFLRIGELRIGVGETGGLGLEHWSIGASELELDDAVGDVWDALGTWWGCGEECTAGGVRRCAGSVVVLLGWMGRGGDGDGNGRG